jgi:hypothetical protein
MKDFTIKINYSWGDKENDIEIKKTNKIDAFMYMLDLAKQEVSNTIHDGHEEDSFNLKVEPNNDLITLTYEYDNEMCYYKLIQKIYCIVISKFNQFGNRIDAFEMSCDTNIEKAKQSKQEYEQRLKDGEFKKLGRILKVELEVRDYESNDLIEIID